MKFAASFDGTAAPTDRRALIRYAGFRMRQVLLDAVKRRQAEKRNYGMRPVEIGDGDVVLVDGDNRQANQAVDVERLDRAMGALESHDPEASTVINALFFGQMSRQEVAVVLGVDVATTENARARGKRFLREWLTASGTSDGFS